MSESGPPLIDVQHASVTRGERVVLHDVTLRIEVGEHAAILGPNGCGKSTLVKMLTRECYPLARPGSSVKLFGREVWNIFELRSLLGIVASDFPPPTRPISGIEMVLSGFFSSIGLWSHQDVTSDMEDQAQHALAQLEAGHLAERNCAEMSSGEARRILIARALVHSPKALLLDEPSTSLDLFAQHELREAMRRLAQAGVAILLVTHQLSDIIPEIDRVILMKFGRVMADGRKRDLLSPEPIEKLFGTRVDLSERNGYVHAW
ncbi:MAG TPA: ATP-binding cassette domain-containing protein [Bryobacteraceae bacterium]|nr:ATP-binding cassette domain-containing protein [Bryobacteraceae bacterium]